MRKEILLAIICMFAWIAPTPMSAQTRTTPQTPAIEEPIKTQGYGLMLFKMFLALTLVCVLAFVILKWGMGRLVTHSGKDANMQVLARMSIEPRRSIMVVRVGRRTLVVASSEAGLELLTELHGQDAQDFVLQGDKTQKEHQKRAFPLPKTDEKDTL